MTTQRAPNSSFDEATPRRTARHTPAEAPRTGFFGRRKETGDPLQESVDCLIGPDAEIEGDLIFTGGLRIDGRVIGDVSVSKVDAGTLVIGNDGRIEGDVRVSHVIIYGEIRGTIYATGLVDLRTQARIFGDVHYGSIEIQAGATMHGHLISNKVEAGLKQ
jgi:cytoskeletal protein CcmA (bactofilin family)